VLLLRVAVLRRETTDNNRPVVSFRWKEEALSESSQTQAVAPRILSPVVAVWTYIPTIAIMACDGELEDESNRENERHSTYQTAVLELLELVQGQGFLVREEQRVEAEVPCTPSRDATRHRRQEEDVPGSRSSKWTPPPP